MKDTLGILALLTGLYATTFAAVSGESPKTCSSVDKARQAAREGKVLYKLTTPEELKAVLGPPQSEKSEPDGGMEILDLQYADLSARFGRMSKGPGPFTVLWLADSNSEIDIGQNRQVVLRSADDLAKFDPFWGFAGVSLAALDLRERKVLLEKMPFDSRTQWPSGDKLPAGFDPARRIEEGKTPGLGVPRLHVQGIDGHGVGIAIIDQPLLKEHQEYAGQLVRYEPVDVQGVEVQMHGPPVSSIAVGRRCGVAPKAALYYYAVPTWKWEANKPYAELLEKIVQTNKTLTDGPKIRVVSISLGMFSQWPDFDLWQAAVAKASQNGILVVTCDTKFLRLAILQRDPKADPNDPACYTTGWFAALRAALCVPGSHRTTASHEGRDVYTYWVEGGLSWCVPYLAGLAALAFQIDPEIPPAQIVELWTATATKTAAGPIVNPPKFIEAVRSRVKKTP